MSPHNEWDEFVVTKVVTLHTYFHCGEVGLDLGALNVPNEFDWHHLFDSIVNSASGAKKLLYPCKDIFFLMST